MKIKYYGFMIFIALITIPALAQMPLLERDRSGQSALLIPQGWTVNLQQQNDVYILRMDETPGAADSPTIMVITRTVITHSAAISNVQAMLNSIAAFMTEAQILEQGFSDSKGFVLWQGVIDGIAAKMAAFSVYDPSQQLVFGALFAAPPARFDRLGGAALLFAVLERPQTLTSAPITEQTRPQPLDINRYETQVRLLKERTRVDPKALIGRWMQGISVPTGQVFEELISGQRFYDHLGHGFLVEFHADNRYELFYHYSHTYQGCENKIKMAENGRYVFDGLMLSLEPDSYEGHIQSCAGQPMASQNNNPPQRTYEVGFDTTKQLMVIRGSPPHYVIGKLGEAGSEYIREGFSRQQ